MALRDWIKAFLLKRNTVLSKPPGQFIATDYKLARIRDRGLKIDVAIDGGAALGAFTEVLKAIYPDARIVMIEPREDARPSLASVARKFPGVTIVNKLIGSEVGEVEYFDANDRSSILPDHDGTSFGVKKHAAMTTIDQLMEEMALTPDFIKLDVQGAELEVLAGATRSLSAASAVLMEVSMLEFQKGNPLLADVIKFMDERDFRVYDILALWHRPLDGALAQGDFFFLKNGHSLLADKRWRTETQLYVAQ
jgi:FkbM family methyltransferase